MSKFKQNWFLAALAIIFAIGFFASEPLTWFHHQAWLRNTIVFVVMALTGLTLSAGSVAEHFRRPAAPLLAIALNIFAVPLACYGAIFVLPQQYFGGLFVASLVPCTLASAAVWTRKADGDDSVALLTTVVTNLTCIVVIPIGIAIGLGHHVEISIASQMSKLAILVVAPLTLAQAIRRIGFDLWADQRKPMLSFVAQLGILTMVFFGAISSQQYATSSDARTTILAFTTLVAVVIIVHLGCLILGIQLSRQCGFSRHRQIAVGFSGSQKTLMIGLQIAIDCGVSIVPMITYHVAQLFLDTIVAERWKNTSPDLQATEQNDSEQNV